MNSWNGTTAIADRELGTAAIADRELGTAAIADREILESENHFRFENSLYSF